MKSGKNEIAEKKYVKRTRAQEVWGSLRRNPGAMIGMIIVICLILLAIFADVIFDYETQVIGYVPKDRLLAPCAAHPFGTDDMGRDLFCRVLYGTKFSLVIGIASVAIGGVLGIPLGAYAGYYGGTIDDIIMRITDIFSAVPPILMGIVVVAALGANTTNLIIAIGLTNVPNLVRITRASVMSVKNQQYIEAARASGLKEQRIIFTHVLPNCLSPILVSLTLRVASSIVQASGLSFLGLGIPAPLPEWGAMLSAGRAFIRQYSYMTLFPGLAIMITVLSLNLFGDGLRDALDPKLRK